MRLWTKQARRDAFKGAQQATSFSKICMVYIYIRKHLAAEEPSTIKLKFR